MNKLTYLHIAPRQTTPGKAPLLVMLHGYAEDETRMASLSAQLDPRLHIVSVRAPIRLKKGSYAWCHVRFTPLGPSDNVCEAEESRFMLVDMLKSFPQKLGCDATNIYVMGFSQGATMALNLALSIPERLAGAASLCGRALPETLTAPEYPEAMRGLPVLLIASLEDTVVPIRHVRATYQALQDSGMTVTWREFSAGHEILPEMIQTLNGWLQEQLNA